MDTGRAPSTRPQRVDIVLRIEVGHVTVFKQDA